MGNKRGKKALDLPLFPALYPLFPMEASGRPWTILDGSRVFYLVNAVCLGPPETALDAILVCPEGLEPPTCCLEGNCSIQLSYGQCGRRLRRRGGGRGGGIRTRDLLVPNQLRYQAALRPERMRLYAAGDRPQARSACGPTGVDTSATLILLGTEQDLARLVVLQGLAQTGEHLDAALHRRARGDAVEPCLGIREIVEVDALVLP